MTAGEARTRAEHAREFSMPRPRFTLTDTSGAPFDFWSKTKGVVTLLFFAYTSCPSECPLHVENIKLGFSARQN
jgi:cytochrome oxidase Cu insertion factor (SCO1/SenC/PrrC family)